MWTHVGSWARLGGAMSFLFGDLNLWIVVMSAVLQFFQPRCRISGSNVKTSARNGLGGNQVPSESNCILPKNFP